MRVSGLIFAFFSHIFWTNFWQHSSLDEAAQENKRRSNNAVTSHTFSTRKVFLHRKLSGGTWRSQSESAARLSHPACRITLCMAQHMQHCRRQRMHAQHACLGRSPIGGTTKQGFPENAESALLPKRKRRFYPSMCSKLHGQK